MACPNAWLADSWLACMLCHRICQMKCWTRLATCCSYIAARIRTTDAQQQGDMELDMPPAAVHSCRTLQGPTRRGEGQVNGKFTMAHLRGGLTPRAWALVGGQGRGVDPDLVLDTACVEQRQHLVREAALWRRARALHKSNHLRKCVSRRVRRCVQRLSPWSPVTMATNIARGRPPQVDCTGTAH